MEKITNNIFKECDYDVDTFIEKYWVSRYLTYNKSINRTLK